MTDVIQAACEGASASGLMPSDETKKLLLKRVSPKNALNFDSLERYWVVLLDELSQILDRILAYPYVVQYRKVLKSAPRELLMAWQIHSQSLRSGELYIVQDRTCEFLKFLSHVGRDCGITISDQTKTFEKAFKKTFERRLRERHRVVHAHERPSWESRIISLSGQTSPLPEDAIKALLMETFEKTMPTLQRVSSQLGKEPPMSVAAVEKIHEEGAVKEARLMLDLVAKALLSTIGLMK
ncbi:hypothetical protein FHS26_005891 [Rhizobium pisi]|nr:MULTISPECIES: hypothetical protein [Rhizobium]MBB3138113.1 hypothetical protein [Rhizobium pisi]TAV45406.1 hypothetical protein ELI31_26460 [Rhizobium leguminosarum]TAV45964.1 hypothetical protein ELI32_27770 [Rhizobium leguminosarum]TAV63819.1 hypothetical protein ELI30_27540 [Rhizobium leguminosarum]TAX05557.1 hypothetical protein ELI07_25155 [Rhizobium leguminosarum]